MHEDIFVADTPQRMRAAINKSSYTHPLVRRVFDLAHIEGLSGEDKMTILAGHLLRQNDELHKQLIRNAELMASPMLVAVPK
ncbi:MAG: hypothetical protein LLG14_27395 [Nocardiaceae bacterium]|nr:hypothetical protein [Nocardiaceae bacterium]